MDLVTDVLGKLQSLGRNTVMHTISYNVRRTLKSGKLVGVLARLCLGFCRVKIDLLPYLTK